MSHKKFGPDRFSRFDVYWIQTNKQTDKTNLYIEVHLHPAVWKQYNKTAVLHLIPLYVYLSLCVDITASSSKLYDR